MLLLLRGKRVVADNFVDFDQILALLQGLEGSAVDKNGLQLGVIEDVRNVLISQGIV